MTKMTTKKIIVITAFLLVFIAAVASASETLNGTVVNTPSADRIPNANVTLSFLDGTLIATTLTDANGFYTMTFDMTATNVTNLTIDKTSVGYLLDSTPSVLLFDEQNRTINKVLGPVMTNTISGKVTNVCDGSTINSATLTMTGNEVFTTTTGIGDLPPGDYSRFVLNATYQVVATAPSYQASTTQTANATNSSIASLNFALTPTIGCPSSGGGDGSSGGGGGGGGGGSSGRSVSKTVFLDCSKPTWVRKA